MLWYFARVAEHEERWIAAKEAWRLIIKHHRGASTLSIKHHNPSQSQKWMQLQDVSLRAALNHYDSLTKFEKDLYDKYLIFHISTKYIEDGRVVLGGDLEVARQIAENLAYTI